MTLDEPVKWCSADVEAAACCAPETMGLLRSSELDVRTVRTWREDAGSHIQAIVAFGRPASVHLVQEPSKPKHLVEMERLRFVD
jgi:hypothetical protein